jgi:hypothetical protein
MTNGTKYLILNFRKTIIILIAIFITSFSVFFVKASSSEVISSNNFIFPKIYSTSNDSIFYASLYDNKLYRINLNNNERIEICSDSISDNGIIIWDQWIYYINRDDNSFYKIRDDGSCKTRLGEVELQAGNDPFFVWKNYIYYIDSTFILHKMNSNGEEVMVSDDKEFEILFKLNSKAVQNGDYIYIPKHDGIVKINNETGEIIKLCEDKAFDNIEVDDDWVYYVNSSDYKLHKVSTDGKEKTKILNDILITEGPDYDVGNFYIAENSIYYTLYEGGATKLASVDFDGQNKRIILDKVVDFTIEDRHIYYFDDIDNGGLYKVEFDGYNKKKIVSGDFIPYISMDQNLIFYGTKSIDIDQPHNGRLFILNQDGTLNMELK